MKNEMTIEKALSEGYEFCGKQSEQWQCLTPIKELTEIDIAEGCLFLASKKPDVFHFGKDQIAELLADVVASNESQDTGRDDDEIYDAVKEIDFTETEKQLTEVFEKFPSYKLTDIKLV